MNTSIRTFGLLGLLLLNSLTASSCSNDSTKAPVYPIRSIDPSATDGDMQALEHIVGDAVLVCLGESRHDIHEQFLLKDRMIRFLVREMGFRAFVLEASLPYCSRINEHILNEKGDLDSLMADMPGWFLWDTREMKSILEWLRRFNQDQQPEDRVHFYGIDIVAPGLALSMISDYLQEVDPATFSTIQEMDLGRELIVDEFWPASMENHAGLDQERSKALRSNYAELGKLIEKGREAFIRRSSAESYEWILQLSRSALAANRMFTAPDRLEGGLIRDRAMAGNTLWVMGREDRTIVWAHNVHIAKSSFTMSMMPEASIAGMGQLLSDSLGRGMRSIGGAFEQGHIQGRELEPAAAGSWEHFVAGLGPDHLLIDLQAATEDQGLRRYASRMSLIRGQDFEMECVPSDAFDAFFFTRLISPVSFNPATAERMRH